MASTHSGRGAAGSNRGFSLVEAVLATGLLASALVSLGQLFAISVANNRSARVRSYVAVLAQQKMEQLRSLAWGFDPLGAPVSDTGLSLSPSDALTADRSGWVDYLDEAGNILGGGTSVPPKAVYVRRWAIEPLPENPAHTIVIRVLATTRAASDMAEASASPARLLDQIELTTIKTRKAP